MSQLATAPIGYDSKIIAGLLSDILEELRQQREELNLLRGKQPSLFKRLIGRLYWLSEDKRTWQ